MKLMIAQKKIDDAFDAHLEHLVEVLMQNSSGQPENISEFVANFHRGIAMAAQVHDDVFKELATIFPE